LQHVPGFVPENAHALGHGAALDVDDHLALEPHQAGMSEIEGNRDAGRVIGAEPLVGHPGVRPDAKPPLAELRIELVQAPLEPRACDGDLEVLEAQLEEFVVGQGGPGKPTRHGASNPKK
jgi:hypothetical protein